jgi:hypothetical protein
MWSAFVELGASRITPEAVADAMPADGSSTKRLIVSATSRGAFPGSAVQVNADLLTEATAKRELLRRAHEVTEGIENGLPAATVHAQLTAGLDALRYRRRADPLQLRGVALSTVEAERVDWLWVGFVPLGKVTVLDGDPGVGKSVLVTDLAARVTTCRPMPGEELATVPASRVLHLVAEDGIADTLRPRYEAAGADLDLVEAVDTVATAEGNDERLVVIPDDLARLERRVVDGGCRLVIVDVFAAFVSSDLNVYRDQDVRRATTPLSKLAERTGCSIVLVRHLNKSSDGPALYRGGGSIGIAGAARSVLLAAPHPDDDTTRVLAAVKSNLAPRRGFTYTIAANDQGTAVVVWGAETDVHPDTLVTPMTGEERSALAEACEVITTTLADGPMPSTDLENVVTKQGVSLRTYRRARKVVGVARHRTSEGRWMSALPGQECQPCQEFRGGEAGTLDGQEVLDFDEPT